MVWDRIPGRSLYDVIVLRVQSDRLWPAYDMLYPRDQRSIRPQALELTGLQGLAALWCDNGFRLRHKAEVSIRDWGGSDASLAEWLDRFGYPALVASPNLRRTVVRWHDETMHSLMRDLRPLIHPSKKPTLWPPKKVDLRLYACL